jgi:UDP-N-acetylglucosamine/UDP-N-acetyl-alpha-D-glucosaminouronate 4-epimerase
MKVLVTGGAGFIGSNLVRRLAASVGSIRVLDDLSTGSRRNLDGVLGPAVTLLSGDLRDREMLEAAVDGVEVVFHLAALPSVARSVADPFASHAVNVDGTLNLLSASLHAGVRRVIYASSSSVYGNTATLPKHEQMPVATLSPYAASKLAGEAYCRAFTHAYGLETVSLRFFNVFGPRQDPTSPYAAVIPRFLSSMLAGRSPEVYGDGRQSRDFTFVANAVEACVVAAEAGPEAAGEAVNVGCGARTSLLELIEMLNELLATDIQPSLHPSRPGDVRDSEASIAKAGRLLGYHPLVSVRDGLIETARWFAGAATEPNGGPGHPSGRTLDHLLANPAKERR